jgi:hypothetical protein
LFLAEPIKQTGFWGNTDSFYLTLWFSMVKVEGNIKVMTREEKEKTHSTHSPNGLC